MTNLNLRTVVSYAATAFLCTSLGAPASASATAPSSTVLVGATSSGDRGGLAYIDPLTGADIEPMIPQVAFFPGHPDDGLSNISGIAFHPSTGELWAINYQCEVITIDLTTGVSAPVVESVIVPDPASQCEGLAITAAGAIYAGHSGGGAPARIAQLDGDAWIVNTESSFDYISWLAYDATSDRVFLGDYTGESMVVKSVGASQIGDVREVGVDTSFLSSLAFGPADTVWGGYWGDALYTGTASALPGDMVETGEPAPSAYWLAAQFSVDEAVPEEESELAATGITGFTSGLWLAALAGGIVGLTVLRRRT